MNFLTVLNSKALFRIVVVFLCAPPRAENVDFEDTWLIIGGNPDSIENFPYHVAVMLVSKYTDKELYRCGGSIIGVEHVLTAAHCLFINDDEDDVIFPWPTDGFQVLAGVDHWSDKSTRKKVKEYKVHPLYNRCKNYQVCNDIAVIKTEPFKMSNKVSTIAIAPPSASKRLEEMMWKGETCLAAGWGYLSFEGPYPNTLHSVSLQLVTYEFCYKRYKDYYFAVNSTSTRGIGKKYHICTFHEDRDVCFGDSGGGLVCGQGKNRMVYGVTSFGEGCANNITPGVFARVDNQYNFIMDYVNLKSSVSSIKSILYLTQVSVISTVSCMYY